MNKNLHKKVIALTLALLIGIAFIKGAGSGVVPFSSASADALTDSFYQYFMAKISDYTQSIDVSTYGLTLDDMSGFGNKIKDNLPEAFCVSGYRYSFYSNGSVVAILPNYNMTQSEYTIALAGCRQAADEILSDLYNSPLSDIEKALLVHDRIAVWCEYDINQTQGSESYGISGVLNRHKAVCDGYAITYKYLLNKLNINCGYCISNTLNHRWNMIEINGQLYNVDVTWDDPIYDIYGNVHHDHFMKSSAYFAANDYEANDYEMTAVSTAYDNTFWDNSISEFQYFGGKIYYIDNRDGKLYSCTDSVFSPSLVKTVSGNWSFGSHYIYSVPLSNGEHVTNFSRLGSDSSNIYYSDNSGIYTLDGTLVYSPEHTSSVELIGFTARDNVFYCDLSTGVIATETSREDYGIAYTYSSGSGGEGPTSSSESSEPDSSSHTSPSSGAPWPSESAAGSGRIMIANAGRYNGKTLPYRSSVTFRARVKGSVPGKITWYVDGKEVGTGSSHTVRRAEKDFSIYCTATDGNGKTIVSATENIKIDSGFFARIIAFLKLIFGVLDIFN